MKEIFSQVSSLILGDKAAAVYIAIMLFASLGALIRILYTLIYRNKYGNKTPVEFSFAFFILDSARRFALMILCVYVFARFTDEAFTFFGFPEYSQYEATYYIYILIGMGFDHIAQKKVPAILEKIVGKDKMDAA